MCVAVLISLWREFGIMINVIQTGGYLCLKWVVKLGLISLHPLNDPFPDPFPTNSPLPSLSPSLSLGAL